MKALTLYRSDFDRVIEITWAAIKGRVIEEMSGGEKYLFSLVREISFLYPSTSLLKEDLSQELAASWLNWEKDYSLTNISPRQYFLRRSIWKMRDWLSVEMKQAPIEETYESFTPIVDLDELTLYERYLLLLSFQEEKTDIEISKIVGRTRKTVRKKISVALNKLRNKQWLTE